MPIVSGCPGDLDATGKKRWDETKRFVETSGGGWHDVYASTLERYVRAWALCDLIGEKMKTEPLMIAGSKDNEVINPLLAALDVAARRMDVAAQRLRLTPEARAKIEGGGAPKPPAGGGKFDRLG